MKYLILLPVIFLLSCNTYKNKSQQLNTKDSLTVKTDVGKTGADRDNHGCIASAGYTWSKLKNDCIRIFEQTKLIPVNPGTETYTSAAFLLFNNDQTKAEVFLPNQKESIILIRESKFVWKKDDLEVSTQKGLSLRKNGKVIYQEK